MKKFLGFIIIAIIAALPFTVKAATKLSHICGDADSDGVIVCQISAETTASTITVKLTEHGGAKIDENSIEYLDDWVISEKSSDDGVYTIELTGATTGKVDLFTFSYKVSGEEDCKITLELVGGSSSTITPSNPTDSPADEVSTGSSLPYIALAGIAVAAIYVYNATKNKSKMYKI